METKYEAGAEAPIANSLLQAAVEALRDCDALLINAGAGMGVDSGLPDFRGTEGFWKAYPPLAHLGLDFEDIATPAWFERDPALAWGFYGHRLNLYRRTQPHSGFTLLLNWAQQKRDGYFVFTSNVDGQFGKAGFSDERVVECHGSLHWFQCTNLCSREVWDAASVEITVDPLTLRAEAPLPACPVCGSVARPNVLMFSDRSWRHRRSEAQKVELERWLRKVTRSGLRLTVIECGAGTNIPTVRWLSDRLAATGATLIRINPRHFRGPEGAIRISCGALSALTQIDALWRKQSRGRYA